MDSIPHFPCPVGFYSRPASSYELIARQIVIKARSKYINVADKMCEFVDSFMLYMTTRLPNPHLSPENQAKVRRPFFVSTTMNGAFRLGLYSVSLAGQ